MKRTLAIAAVLATTVAAAQGTEILIYTGGAPTGEGSTYHNGMGKAVEEQIKELARPFGYEVRRVPSGGAVANANACADETENICFGIGQGGLEYDAVTSGGTQIIRNDLPGECAMAFTKEPRLPNWKSVMQNASRVTFVVPEGSGSEAFVKKMFDAEPALEGITPRFKYAKGQQAIFEAVNSIRGAVGVFYAYPNPTDGTIHDAYQEDMTIMGILSPAVAKGSDDFYLNRRAPYALSWFGLGETKTVPAMCSKALLFAGDPATLTDTWAQGDYEDFIDKLKSLPPEAFIPDDGPLSRLMKEVEGLSEEYGVNEMVTDLQKQASEKF
ncbi:hypothetical protein [Acuticoccus mangrovi]|uniref:C4-dicarboxylate ABC transporter substrate-binding protein n=1 Tax=Acuticoccus mangrovi TaxID=2796142 RepID=A0A934IME4_9HYPH|nr:hypothetical protein [Acuticoccus mangrovi]MBJ3777586.1 hypothetical protein [Acuticoccus mangrovi]